MSDSYIQQLQLRIVKSAVFLVFVLPAIYWSVVGELSAVWLPVVGATIALGYGGSVVRNLVSDEAKIPSIDMREARYTEDW